MKFPPYHPFKSAKAREQFLKLYDKNAEKWPVDSETRMVDTPYGQTFVRISGPDNAPPLVLLHGMSGNSLQWIPNIEDLSASYKIYALDNIYDNGRSIYTRPVKSSDDFVKWLDDLFSALELGDNINLLGMSYGGWIASQYALQYSDRLNKIVLVAPAATVLPVRLEFIMLAILCYIIPHRYFSRKFLYWLMEDLANRDETNRKLLEEESENIFMAIQSFKPRRVVRPTVLQDKELQSIKVPALYLVGENEKIYSAEKALGRLNEVAPHIKTEVIPNAGHDLTFLQADLVNRKVLEFLKQP